MRGKGMDFIVPMGGKKGDGFALGTWKVFVRRQCAEFPINCFVGKE